ncbi:MAG: tagaturonate reductase [Candidatus Pseudobacter hemicellulosilyticus]|uniref:Tagaturonate reductase n=1 Tax=Candidatus Pseudobacter hemicellulosilyticus TaxID=3121375 RepID=A0AAJ5X166_9BACT|nr:MAG: tagaturonate reductase [Pseudobacter sp.]
MNLSIDALPMINSAVVELPSASYFQLPEKVLQFGTGVLLRGLPDYFIDKANKRGLFNGRIVVVKSTRGGDSDSFARQHGLYTLCVRGVENGQQTGENIVNASISRMLSARHEWEQILQCASSPDMEIVISNTTEVGIELVRESIHAEPPASFPAKLLAFLYRRFQVFGEDPAKGMVIVPTELIPDNGKKLKSICIELALHNNLEPAFLRWLRTNNHFCSSLVDRIVPGKLPPAEQTAMEQEAGYTDELMIKSEVYRLWAIESDQDIVKEKLSFAQADPGVVIAPDINVFRELKLRLLNGSHTFSCGLAYLGGFTTVKEAMSDSAFNSYISRLMLEEIGPAITGENLSTEMAADFAAKVLDRYRNPYIDHLWISITMQYTSKMKMRNIPVLLKHYEDDGTVPEQMALGFAGYLLFMRCAQAEDGQYYGLKDGEKYIVNDDLAGWFAEKWQQELPGLVQSVLGDKSFWGADLLALPGFAEAVTNNLQQLINEEPRTVFNRFAQPI